jgi:hypothetical protein
MPKPQRPSSKNAFRCSRDDKTAIPLRRKKTRTRIPFSLALPILSLVGHGLWETFHAASGLAAIVFGASLASAQPSTNSGMAIRVVEDSAAPKTGKEHVVWRGEDLWLQPGPGVTGDMVSKAHSTIDQTGRPAIEFTLTPAGKTRLAEITRTNIGRRLAILIDGNVVTAPMLISPIEGGKGMITGDFSSAEANTLASLIVARTMSQ